MQYCDPVGFPLSLLRVDLLLPERSNKNWIGQRPDAGF